MLVAVGIGLAPAPAMADETPTTGDTGASSQAAPGSSTTTTTEQAGTATREIAEPTLLEAFAAAHQANVDIGDVDVRIIGDDDFRRVSDALATVVNFVKNPPDPPQPDIDPSEVVEPEQLLAMVEELRDRVQAMRPVIDQTAEAVLREVAWVRGAGPGDCGRAQRLGVGADRRPTRCAAHRRGGAGARPGDRVVRAR